MYINIDGIIARKLELVDYPKEKQPEIVCLAETKLCEDTQTNMKILIIIYGGRIKKTKKIMLCQ